MKNQKCPSDFILVSRDTIALMLSCSVGYVDYLKNRENLPYIQLGSRVKFDPEQVRLWVNKRMKNRIDKE